MLTTPVKISLTTVCEQMTNVTYAGLFIPFGEKSGGNPKQAPVERNKAI